MKYTHPKQMSTFSKTKTTSFILISALLGVCLSLLVLFRVKFLPQRTQLEQILNIHSDKLSANIDHPLLPTWNPNNEQTGSSSVRPSFLPQEGLTFIVEASMANPVKESGDADVPLTDQGKTFTWGKVEKNSGNFSSSLQISDVGHPIGNIAISTEFGFGMLTFTNGAIIPNTGASSIELTLIPTVIQNGQSIAFRPITMKLLIVNTENTPGDITDARSADIVSLPGQILTSTSVQPGASDFIFELWGIGSADSANGYITTSSGFHTRETKVDSAHFIGIIYKTSDNPYPTGLKVPIPGKADINSIDCDAQGSPPCIEYYYSMKGKSDKPDPNKPNEEGKFQSQLLIKNNSGQTAKFAVCILAQGASNDTTKVENVAIDQWTLSFLQDANGQSWSCNLDTNNKPQEAPTYHFGCREFSIPAQESIAWFDSRGTVLPGGATLTPNLTFLEAPPKVGTMCEYNAPVNNVNGSNHRLAEDSTMVQAAQFSANNYWTLREQYRNRSASAVARTNPLVTTSTTPPNTMLKDVMSTNTGEQAISLAPESCNMVWPAGSNFTIANPSLYLAKFIGQVSDVPAGSIVTLQLPPGSPVIEHQYVVTSTVPPTIPNTPSCVNSALSITEPFVIPPAASTISMTIQVPAECPLTEGSKTRISGRAASASNFSVFQQGDFITGYQGVCVVDQTPPEIRQLAVIPQTDGTILVQASTVDAVSLPLEALLEYQVDGGATEQVRMDYDDPPIKGNYVFFRKLIGPFAPNTKTKVTVTAFDSFGQKVSQSKEETAFTIADLSLTKTAQPNPIIMGKMLTYTLTATNHGPVGATGVTLTDTLPVSLAVASVSSGQGHCLKANNAVTCSLGALAVGASAEVTITGEPTAAGNLINQARITSDILDFPRNNKASAATIVIPPIFYLSFSSSGKVGNLSFTGDDILAFDTSFSTWSMFFNGSDVGITTNLDAFALLPDGSILLSVREPTTLPALGAVDDSDIVRFIPTSLGDNTSGHFEWYLDGSDVGLTTDGEDIDAIGFTSDGRLVISTKGDVDANGVRGSDEDLLVFDALRVGEDTAGSWQLFFDGSDLPSIGDDIWTVWIEKNTDSVFLSTKSQPPGQGSGHAGTAIYFCKPDAPGDDTDCNLSLFWTVPDDELANLNIDGFAASSLFPPQRANNPTGLPDAHKLFLPFVSQ